MVFAWPPGKGKSVKGSLFNNKVFLAGMTEVFRMLLMNPPGTKIVFPSYPAPLPGNINPGRIPGPWLMKEPKEDVSEERRRHTGRLEGAREELAEKIFELK